MTYCAQKQLYFLRFSADPVGTQNVRKNLNFHIFTTFRQYLEIFVNLNMKNQPKQKLSLRYG